MAIEKRSLSGKNPKLTINLNEMFGQRVPDTTTFKESVGQAIIDAIRDQAAESRDRKGKKYANRAGRYSKEYIASDEFKAAGKDSTVDLKLTGDMLGLMDVVLTSRNTITIGWSESDEAAKAHGHILGSDPGPKVKRDFFGLPEDKYESIASGFSLPAVAAPDEPGIISSLLSLRELFGG